jgi:hypothetical protein
VRYDAGITHKISPTRGTGERRSVGVRPAIRNQCIVITGFSIAAVRLTSRTCRATERLNIRLARLAV